MMVMMEPKSVSLSLLQLTVCEAPRLCPGASIPWRRKLADWTPCTITCRKFGRTGKLRGSSRRSYPSNLKSCTSTQHVSASHLTGVTINLDHLPKVLNLPSSQVLQHSWAKDERGNTGVRNPSILPCKISLVVTPSISLKSSITTQRRMVDEVYCFSMSLSWSLPWTMPAVSQGAPKPLQQRWRPGTP